jgi:hypothetical protein
MSGYGNWGKHIELFEHFKAFRDDPVVQAQLAESDEEDLAEGTGAPEGRADFPIYLQTVIRHRFRERFAAVAAKWRSYVGIESAQDFRAHTVSQLNGVRGIQPVLENDEYPMLRTAEEAGPSFAVGKHGGIYSVTFELVINDESDRILNRLPREMGRMSAEYISQTVVAFVESNPTYIDGLPFFTSNVARQNEVTAAAGDPNETNLLAILDIMKLRRDSDGIPFTVDPNRILVRAPSQKATFDRILRSQLTGVQDTAVPAGQTGMAYGDFFTGNYNPAYNVLPPDAVVDEPWFNDPNDWYLLGNAADRPPFIVAFLRGRQDPFIGLEDPGVRAAMGGGSDPYTLQFDHINYKIRHIFGAAMGEPLAAFRARPT